MEENVRKETQSWEEIFDLDEEYQTHRLIIFKEF